MKGLIQKNSTVHVSVIGQAANALLSTICEQNSLRVLLFYSALSCVAFAHIFGGLDRHTVIEDCV